MLDLAPDCTDTRLLHVLLTQLFFLPSQCFLDSRSQLFLYVRTGTPRAVWNMSGTGHRVLFWLVLRSES